MKLKYWVRLAELPEESWTKKAFLECLEAKDATKNGWKSNYTDEIFKIHSKCKVGNIVGNDRSPLQNVVKAVENYTEDILASELSQHRMHSLKYLPDHPSVGVQNYLDGSDASITLTKFRMGNARLGNRSTPQIKICPTCNNGPNNELHLTFECRSMDNLRLFPWMAQVLDQAVDQKKYDTKDPRKLKSFLEGDLASKKVLLERGTFLSILLQKHFELMQSA